MNRKVLIASGLFFMFAHASAVACTATEAFGFQLGKPVPKRLKEEKVIYFEGGSGPGNVIGTYSGKVPAPLADFDHYVYSSNKDRKVVHSIIAYRELITDKKRADDDAYRQAVLDNARLEILQLRQAWQEQYGLVYEPLTKNGLTWEAETDEVRSAIGTYGGEYLYIECENKALAKEALSIAFKSFSRSP